MAIIIILQNMIKETLIHTSFLSLSNTLTLKKKTNR